MARPGGLAEPESESARTPGELEYTTVYSFQTSPIRVEFNCRRGRVRVRLDSVPAAAPVTRLPGPGAAGTGSLAA